MPRLDTRRRFLRRSLAGVVAAQTAVLARSAPGAQLLGIVPFVEEGDFPIGVSVGSGLAARLAFDLSTLTSGTLVTPNERFFVRTGTPDQLRFDQPWKISLGGLVEAPVEVELDALVSSAVDLGVHLIECAGNGRAARFGLISAARWTGVPLQKVIERVKPARAATRVLVSGFDRHSRPVPDSVPGASWVFGLEEARERGAFLATGMNGAALPREHGYPVRLVVPGWYGCASIKWVNEIVLLDDDAPATDQMWEFAGRTHQDLAGPLVFTLTRDFRSRLGPAPARLFKPAAVDLAAMPVRVEEWRVEGKIEYRIAGILWGGDTLARGLLIRFNPGEAFGAVENFSQATNRTWTLWSHAFRPRAPGRFRIELGAADPALRTRRLAAGHYARTVEIREV